MLRNTTIEISNPPLSPFNKGGVKIDRILSMKMFPSFIKRGKGRLLIIKSIIRKHL